MAMLDANFSPEAANNVGTSRRPDGANAALRAADLLGLAAAPTFAAMAMLAGISGGGPADTLCAAPQDAWPLSGMVPMYVLMSAIHLAPWLKLIGVRRDGKGMGWTATSQADMLTHAK
jgi:hypothetical protein